MSANGGDLPSLPPRATALVLALAAGVFMFRLGAVPLLGPDEPRYARVAVEMHRSGEKVTPTLQGRPWLEKPPLYYWLAGAAYQRLGENEAAARLPSALAGLVLVAATALFGARLFGRAAGLHAAFIMATSALPFAYARAASMDMLLAAAVTAVVGLMGLRLLGIAGRLAMPAAYAMAGVAMLAKGPIGLLLPALVGLGFLVLTRGRRLARRLVSPTGAALFALITAPWYVAILRTQGRAFVDEFLLNHNVRRFTSEIHHHPGELWYYLPVLFVGVFPWSGLVLPALATVRPRWSKSDRFVLLWLGLPLLFFSLAGSKLPGYVLPCLPPLAILMGRAADALVRKEPLPNGTGPRAVAVVTLVLSAALAAAAFALWNRGDPMARTFLPLAAWALLIAFTAARRMVQPAAALAVMRVGAVGLLLLVTLSAPPLLAARESGRDLFQPAHGREVLVWGARRTAWMAGYFYNDGRVRTVSGFEEVGAAARTGSTLVLCGAAERRALEQRRDLRVSILAVGPRADALLRVETR